jgi:hypothetical protein
VTLPPWEYLFEKFSGDTFPDLFRAVWVASILLLAGLVILYNVRTRALRHHPPYLEMYEWLLWSGLIIFSLLLVFSLFVWDFIFVLVTIVGGTAILVWIRFIRFPPIFEGYARKLARERYFTRSKFAHPEATIRSKTARTARSGRSTRPAKRRRRR